MSKKIIFVDVTKARNNCYDIIINDIGNALYIEYWKTDSIKSGACYLVDDTVIFSKNTFSEIWVRSRKYKAPMNLSLKFQQRSEEGLLYPYISEVFKIFDDVNAECKSKGKDPIWKLEFDLDDKRWSVVFNTALARLFDSFTLGEPACDTAITKLYYDYHPEALYNMMVKNLSKRDHEDMLDALRYSAPKLRAIDPSDYWPKSLLTEEGKKAYLICSRGNGKTALAQRIMRDYIYGINGGSNMDKLYNFRKNIKEIKRDKKNPGKFLIDNKDGFLSREIVCDGFSKEELYSEEFIESILVIATQIQYDGITKVIFNAEEKLTIIFPHNSYNFSERIIVKANGLDAFDILNGYSIAKAKMLCSGDGYQWYNKLRKSGKVNI